jgi:DNA polymerase-3 subunit beta
LTGVLIEAQPDDVTFVATDSHRLSRQVIHTKTNVDGDVSFVIPAKVFTELSTVVNTFASDDDDMVHIFVLQDSNQVLFRFNDIEMVTRLLEGQFPEYKQIIPTGYQLKVEFTHEDFLNSLKITNIIARNVTGNKVITTFDESKQEIKLSASLNDVGSNESSFDAKIDGNSMKVAFNAKYLLDFAGHMSAQDLVFEAVSDVNAGVFRIKDDNDYIHLVMPMIL